MPPTILICYVVRHNMKKRTMFASVSLARAPDVLVVLGKSLRYSTMLQRCIADCHITNTEEGLLNLEGSFRSGQTYTFVG